MIKNDDDDEEEQKMCVFAYFDESISLTGIDNYGTSTTYNANN